MKNIKKLRRSTKDLFTKLPNCELAKSILERKISGVQKLFRKIANDLEKLKPELVIVSGTNLLAEHLIKTIRAYAKIINLHTGISPYVKGGPNCTNWCIYHANFSFIGNTVMYFGNILFNL